MCIKTTRVVWPAVSIAFLSYLRIGDRCDGTVPSPVHIPCPPPLKPRTRAAPRTSPIGRVQASGRLCLLRTSSTCWRVWGPSTTMDVSGISCTVPYDFLSGWRAGFRWLGHATYSILLPIFFFIRASLVKGHWVLPCQVSLRCHATIFETFRPNNC